jgi:Holliday junction resolvase RusA-like endonuclease
MRIYELKVIPVGKPRMTKRDKWKHRPVVDHYYAFKDQLRLQANIMGLRDLPGEIGAITFILPMADSWSESKKVRYDKKPHQQKPDLDNMNKALFDSLNVEDKNIWYVGKNMKVWGRVGKIIIEIE